MTNETTETKKTPANWRDLPEIEVKVTEKECGKCKLVLPVANFWKMRTSKDGLQPACKDCQMGVAQGAYTGKTAKVPAEKKPAKKPAKKAEPEPVAVPAEEAPVETTEPKQAPEVTKKVSKKEKPASDKTKKARPSRAAPVGSGRRKECANCTFQIKSTEGGRCISADAEKDGENKAKICPHLVESKTAKNRAKKARK